MPRNIVSVFQSEGGEFPQAAGAVVDFDAATTQLQLTATDNTSFSHTCTGSSRALVVFVVMIGAGQSVSGITYNGVALSSIGSRNHPASASRIEAWGLAAPASGSNTVAVTLSAANAAWDVIAISFVGANQSGGASTFNGFTGFDLDDVPTGDVVITTENNSMVVDCTCSTTGNGTTSTPGTQQWLDNSGATNTKGQTLPSNASTETLTENWDSDGDHMIVGLNVSHA